MANFSQSNTYGQYFGYGPGMQYDASQSKWVQGSTGNQTQSSQNPQSKQQVYQSTAQAAEYYAAAAAAGYPGYGNQMYGQQQGYGTGANSVGMTGTANTSNTAGNTSIAATGAKIGGSFGSATGTAANSANLAHASTNSSSGTGSGTGNFGSGGSFGNTAAGNSANALNQMFGAAYGNAGNNSGMNSTNAASATTGQTLGNTTTGMTGQTFGNNATGVTGQTFGNDATAGANAMGQLSQMFGNGTGFGNNMSGDAMGGNFGAGYNAFNSGMMTLLQQSLLQQASGAAAFSTGGMWGMPDGDGGYYAPPMDTNFGGAGGKQGKKGKKWSGKDSNKQDFYGNRFAQMFTGMPGVLGQSQSGGTKTKRLQDGVRINVKGEKVVDVEVPLSLYSRWGQLRKFFYKQDTEVVKHLLEFHDEMCEDCLEREQRKKKRNGESKVTQESSAKTADGGEVSGNDEIEGGEDITEMSEEELAIQQVMGFASFNTTRGAMVEGNQVDTLGCASTVAKSAKSSTWEAKAGFIGPTVPQKDKPESESKTQTESEGGNTLSEEEKLLMKKLGWTVFNRKKQDEENGKSDNDDDDEKVDDGGKDGSAVEGKAP